MTTIGMYRTKNLTEEVDTHNWVSILFLFWKGDYIMEIKKGDKLITVPGWVLAAGIVTLGAMVTDICKVAISKQKK